jgi:hypothetical protein
VIWLKYFEKVIWLDFNGQVLGERTPRNVSGSINVYDVPNGRFIECLRERTTEVLACTATTPGRQEPDWLTQVSGVAIFDPGQASIRDGHLFVLSEEQTLSKFYIGQP